MLMNLMKLNLMKSKMDEGVVKVGKIERLVKIVKQVEKTEANYRVDE